MLPIDIGACEAEAAQPNRNVAHGMGHPPAGRDHVDGSACGRGIGSSSAGASGWSARAGSSPRRLPAWLCGAVRRKTP